MAIHVTLCCNDDHGNFSGELYELEVFVNDDMLIHLDSNFMPDAGATLEIAEPIQGVGAIFVNGKPYPIEGHATYVGNIYWDEVIMRRVHVQHLLDDLRDMKYKDVCCWCCQEAATRLFDAWNSGERLDLDVAN